MRKIVRKIFVMIGILLLFNGSTYAEDNIPIVAEDNVATIVAVTEDNTSITREDFVHKLSNGTKASTNNNSIDMKVDEDKVVDEDTNGSSTKEKDIIFGDTEKISTEKKSSPGFGSIVTIIVILSMVIIAKIYGK